MEFRTKHWLSAFGIVAAVGMTGCEEQNEEQFEQGVTQTGEAIGDTAENAWQETEQEFDEAERGMEQAGADVEQEWDEAERGMEQAGADVEQEWDEESAEARRELNEEIREERLEERAEARTQEEDEVF